MYYKKVFFNKNLFKSFYDPDGDLINKFKYI